MCVSSLGERAATDTLLEMVAPLTEPSRLPKLLAMLGPSGSGKSSLVRAGLLPALQAGRLKEAPNWLIQVMLPGARPLDSLAQAMAPLLDENVLAIRDSLKQSDETALHLLLQTALNQQATPESYIALVIDQFEELFTLCQDEPTRRAFLSQLLDPPCTNQATA